MLKICTGEAPYYLTDKFSKVEARNPYNIRNSELNINLLLVVLISRSANEYNGREALL